MAPTLRARLLLCLALLFAACPARAWNETGHMTVAYIAYKDLKPEVRQRVTELLRQHPRYQQDLLRDMPEGFADPDLYAFLKAASWPDAVRDLRNPMHATHHHPNWHYVDFPFVAPADRETMHPPTPETEGGEVNNVLKALTKTAADLRNPSIPGAEKAVAVCWLAHMIGDIHQPLHATSYFSEAFPAGDKGGNLFLVRGSGGDVVNLHALWDGMLGPESSPAAIKLIADDILASPNRQRPALASVLAHATYKSWADESYAACREFVYLDGRLRTFGPDATPRRGAAPASNPATSPATTPDTPNLFDRRRDRAPATAPALPTSYEAVGRLLATERAALAGYRLADQLNEILSQP